MIKAAKKAICNSQREARYLSSPVYRCRVNQTVSMVATGQEIVREKKILQGQGKVREFHFESGKIYIFEKSQGKVKF